MIQDALKSNSKNLFRRIFGAKAMKIPSLKLRICGGKICGPLSKLMILNYSQTERTSEVRYEDSQNKLEFLISYTLKKSQANAKYSMSL